jgi:hypothetical protein
VEFGCAAGVPTGVAGPLKSEQLIPATNSARLARIIE